MQHTEGGASFCRKVITLFCGENFSWALPDSTLDSGEFLLSNFPQKETQICQNAATPHHPAQKSIYVLPKLGNVMFVPVCLVIVNYFEYFEGEGEKCNNIVTPKKYFYEKEQIFCVMQRKKNIKQLDF